MNDAPPVTGESASEAGAPEPPAKVPLRRAREQKVIAGVCGGLGRYFDIDPVIFRVVLSVLAVAGGVGLIAYGFCWLLVPLRGEDENEGRRLLSGRVEGPALTAVLCALVGCGLFLSMLNDGAVIAFSLMLTTLVAGAASWSQHRRLAEGEGAVDAATAHAVADAPPETKAPPPARGGPSWWRDPIVKDGTTGPIGAGSGYLWGPDDGRGPRGGAQDAPYGPRDAAYSPYGPYGLVVDKAMAAARSRRAQEGPSIGGWAFLLAVVAGAVSISASWSSQPLGTSLEIGLAAALVVLGLGLVLSCLFGRTGAGTIVLVVVVSVLLTGAAALPKSISTDFSRRTWTPASAGAVRSSYELGAGVGELKLARVPLQRGQTLATRVDVGAGKLAVTVPRDARVELTIDVGLGDIRLPDEKRDDIDIAPGRHRAVTLAPADGRAANGTLELDLQIGMGSVEVTRS